MQWGSQWATTTYSGINQGGSQFYGVNPLLRVTPPQADATTGSPDIAPAMEELPRLSSLTVKPDAESFERQRLGPEYVVVSLPSRDRSMTRVPSLVDHRLVVAPQSPQHDETTEFMLLIAAATDDECYHL